MNVSTRCIAFLAALCLNFSFASSEEEKTPVIPDLLDLQTTLKFALENNFAIRKAQQQIEEQHGLIVEVRAQALPDVSLSGQYVEIDEDLIETYDLYPASTQSWGISLNVRQAVYKGGGVRAALAVQKLMEEVSLLQLESVISESLLQAREGFYNVLLARKSIQVQEDSLELLQEQLKDAKDRFDVGTVSQFEVLRAEVSVANARPPLISARNEYRLAIEELRQILGFQTRDATQLEKVPEFQGDLVYAPRSFELVDLLAQAQELRPELVQARKILEAREKGVKIARSNILPEVNLIGSYQMNRSGLSNDFDDRLEGWTAGVEVNVPIFDGFRTKGLVMQARSQAAQSELDVAEMSLAVEVEVRRAFSDLQEAKELAAASIKVVDQAEESVRLAEARYSAGEATQLDVLQASVALTEARLNQQQAFFSYNVAEARILKAIGEADVYRNDL